MKKFLSILSVVLMIFLFVMPFAGVKATVNFSVITFVVNPQSAESYAGYILDMKLTNALPKGNYIYINFPQGFVLPQTVSPELVTVNGESSSRVEISSGMLKIYPSADISSGSEVVVMIKKEAMIKNPSAPGDYGFLIGLSNEANPLSVVVTVKQGVSKLKTLVQPNTSNSFAMYLIDFYTSQNGALSGANGDYIALVFPKEVVFTESSINPSDVTVNGVPAKSVSVSGNNVTVVLNEGLNIAANSFVSVQISSDCGIKNPSVPGKYFISVLTNKDPFLVNTVYTIKGTSVKGLSVSLNPRIQNAVSEIKITFVTSGNGSLKKNEDKIFVLFPSGFSFPESPDFSFISINGVKANSGTVDNGLLSVIVPADIPAGAVNVIIDKGFGLRNPSNKGEYMISVYTSKDLTPVSASVDIEPSHITAPLVELSNYGAGMASSYTIVFYTGAGGSLKKNEDTVTIVFPRKTLLPASKISKNYIKVNDLSLPDDASVSGESLTFKVPTDVNAYGKVSIKIDKSAGIVNPETYGIYTLSVFTSVEKTPVFSVGYEISILPESYAEVLPESPDGLNGYYVTPPVVELFAKSPKDPKPVIYYYLDSGNPVIYSDKITIPEGKHELHFYAMDHFGNKESKIHSLSFKVDTTPPQIIIVSPTNSVVNGNSVTLKGKTDPGATVTIDGAAVPVKTDGSFETVLSGKGEKTFDISAKDLAGNRSDKKITFTFAMQNSTPPKLTIISPQDGTIVYQNQIIITGKTDSGANVSVNGNPVSVSGDGTFTATVTLDEGSNTITIVSEKDGAEATVKLNVEYTKAISMKLQIGNTNAIVNGEVVSLDSPPVIINSRTLVPLRFISESFGADIQWDPVLRMVSITFNDTKIILQIGNKFASVNGKKVVLDSPPQIINGRTMVPIRFIAESFSANVGWDDATKTITITYP